MCVFSSLDLRLYPTRAPIAISKLMHSTGALLPRKSDIRPCTVPPEKRHICTTSLKKLKVHKYIHYSCTFFMVTF